MERQVIAKVQKMPTGNNHTHRQSARSTSAVHPLLELQRAVGNQAIRRLASSSFIQAKLQISTPGDPSEQEADRVAESVMRMPEPAVSRQSIVKPVSHIRPLAHRETDRSDEGDKIVAPKSKSRIPIAVREDDDEAGLSVLRVCDKCEEEKRQNQGQRADLVQRKPATERMPDDEDVEEQQIPPTEAQHVAPKVTTSVAANIHAMNGGGSSLSNSSPGGVGVTSAPSIVHDALSSPGQPLGMTERAFFEPRFGRDFGDVRVHTDSISAKSATAINALAYTVGQEIVFAKGQYAPNSTAGERLLAHELVHTIQQPRGVISSQTASSIQRTPDDKPSIMDTVSEPAGGCGLCYGGPQKAGTAVHKVIQQLMVPGGVIIDELPLGNGFIDLAVVDPEREVLHIGEIKPANEKGMDSGIEQIEERLRVRRRVTKDQYYAGYKRVALDYPVQQPIRFPTGAPFCEEQPGYCFSQNLIVVRPKRGFKGLYLYFCEPSYSELLSTGCDCDCEKLKEKREKKKEKDKESSPSETLPEKLERWGGELAALLAAPLLLDIGLAIAGVLGAIVSSPLIALAAVVLGIALLWDKLKWLGSKIAGAVQWVWNRIEALADWVFGKFKWILGKLEELGIKLAELVSWLAGKIAWLVGKLAEGLGWIARKIAAGGRWLGRKIASAAEAIWDWLFGSDVEATAPNIELPVIEEPTQHCSTVAYEDTVIKLDSDILFPFREWKLRPEADYPLAKAAVKIRAMLQKDDWIRFEGYTDIIGSGEFNKHLSERRADAVASWFVEHGVVPVSKVRTEGYGKTKAQAKSNDEEGRKKDRRVEIWLPKRGSTKKVCW
jgi:outer membrane protein OmpA-like peptidoglycan-associated protein